MVDSILNPNFQLKLTQKFCVFDYLESTHTPVRIYLDVNCSYTSGLLQKAIARRPWCKVINSLDDTEGDQIIQFCDFENITWEVVLNNKTRASSYLIRKGLSRKAQLSQQIKRYTCKHINSILKKAVPTTVIIETWNAFEKIELYFGGGTFASFDTSSTLQAPLRQRLEWCLDHAKEVIESENCMNWKWILKPSVTNKGVDISIVSNWEQLLDSLEYSPDIREWVLQKYIL
jgi:hypothetical protein